MRREVHTQAELDAALADASVDVVEIRSEREAREYHPAATRYVACRVDASTVRPISGGTPKCKVPRLTVLHEVDLSGAPVAAEAVTR